jgi:hypothetical protein
MGVATPEDAAKARLRNQASSSSIGPVPDSLSKALLGKSKSQRLCTLCEQ